MPTLNPLASATGQRTHVESLTVSHRMLRARHSGFWVQQAGPTLAEMEGQHVKAPSHARTGVVTWVSVSLALGLVAVATLVPTARSADVVPFWCLGCGDYALSDAVANIVLFVPLGWAMSRAGVRTSLGLAVVVTTTIGVEWLQFRFIPGRVASLADILTNTIGGVAGMGLPGVRRRIVETGPRAVRGASLYGVLLLAGLVVGEATQAVLLPRTLYWTEGSGDTTHYVPFTGSQRTVRVDGLPVTMHRWLDTPRREVVEVAVDLVSGRPDTGLAQVVIAWLPSGSGWMWLEQRSRDLHLHLASGSDRARLRGHSVWLRGVMPASSGEPVRIRLVVRRFAYQITIGTNAGAVVRAASVGQGDGWRLFTPAEREWGVWTMLLTGIWMAALLAPLGYVASVPSRAAVAIAAGAGAVILLLLPLLSGCAWLSLPGWCGAAGGFLVGCLGGRATPSEGLSRPSQGTARSQPASEWFA